MTHAELKAALPAIEAAYAAARDAFLLANQTCSYFGTPPSAHVKNLAKCCKKYHAAGRRLDKAHLAIIELVRAQEQQS